MKQPSMMPVTVAGHGRDPQYVDLYANQVRIASSLSDLIITFSVADDLGPNQIFLKDLAAMRLTMVTAKTLAFQLMAGVKAYEATVGEIPAPQSFENVISEMQKALEQNFTLQLNPNSQPGESKKK